MPQIETCYYLYSVHPCLHCVVLSTHPSLHSSFVCCTLCVLLLFMSALCPIISERGMTKWAAILPKTAAKISKGAALGRE